MARIAGLPRFWSTLRLRAADALELVFGPDPGLLRLRTAARTVISAAITLTALLLLRGGEGMKAAAAIALGFMFSIFANMTVRDPKPMQQAATLLMLIVPVLGSVALASFLSQWPWVPDLCFIPIVMGAALARLAGPRGMAIGMVAYIGYFIGVIIHPPFSEMPQLVIAVAIGLAASALTRFVLLRESPQATLRQVTFHLDRRLDRILSQADAILAAGSPERVGHAQRARAHGEVARLNDALLVAQDQIEAIGHAAEPERLGLSACFLRLELAAERLMRMAVRHPDRPDRELARRRIAELRYRLSFGDIKPPPANPSQSKDTLLATLDDLQQAIAALSAAPILRDSEAVHPEGR